MAHRKALAGVQLQRAVDVVLTWSCSKHVFLRLEPTVLREATGQPEVTGNGLAPHLVDGTWSGGIVADLLAHGGAEADVGVGLQKFRNIRARARSVAGLGGLEYLMN